MKSNLAFKKSIFTITLILAFNSSLWCANADADKFVGVWMCKTCSDRIIIKKDGSNYLVDVQESYSVDSGSDSGTTFKSRFKSIGENKEGKIEVAFDFGMTVITLSADTKKIYYVGNEFIKADYPGIWKRNNIEISFTKNSNDDKYTILSYNTMGNKHLASYVGRMVEGRLVYYENLSNGSQIGHSIILVSANCINDIFNEDGQVYRFKYCK